MTGSGWTSNPGPETRFYRAPGRVNLIGEHTDYAGGLVLPCAVERAITLEARASDDIRLESDYDPGAEMVVGAAGGVLEGWGAYVAAVATELELAGRPAVGLRGRLRTDLPAGAGLSSSAALEVCVAIALCDVAGFVVAPADLARLCQRAEMRAVGVPCGVMDQAASLLGRAGHALLLDCGTMQYEHVALPADLRIVVIDSGERRALASVGYAERRREVEMGLAGSTDAVVLRRMRHVTTENDRVREAVRALQQGSPERLGSIFHAGHQSLRDDFEVTTPAVDLLVSLCEAEGALAARMTGGGFGGSVLALTRDDDAARLAAAVADRFATETGGRPPGWDILTAADGAGRMR